MYSKILHFISPDPQLFIVDRIPARNIFIRIFKAFQISIHKKDLFFLYLPQETHRLNIFRYLCSKMSLHSLVQCGNLCPLSLVSVSILFLNFALFYFFLLLFCTDIWIFSLNFKFFIFYSLLWNISSTLFSSPLIGSFNDLMTFFFQFLRMNRYSLIWFPLYPVLIWWIVSLFLSQIIYEALVFLLPGSSFSVGTCVFAFWLGWPACFYHMKGISKSWQCLLVFTLEREVSESWYFRAWQSMSIMDCSQARAWPTPKNPWSPIDGPLLLNKQRWPSKFFLVSLYYGILPLRLLTHSLSIFQFQNCVKLFYLLLFILSCLVFMHLCTFICLLIF